MRNSKHIIWFVLLLPFLLANKECKTERDITWGKAGKDLAAPWAEYHKNIEDGAKCVDCHDDIKGKDSRPKTHDATWIKEHGSYITKKYGYRSQNMCYLCHQESTCAKCHQQEPPRDHTNFWRLKGHAVQISLDRTRCFTCHRGADFCERCHSETKPQSHNAGWGMTANRHCLNCHWPINSIGSQNCFACHRSTPTHTNNTPSQPNNALHVAGADCRSCHVHLRHLDNGMDCSTCHTQ